MSKKLTTTDFIIKSKEKFENLYDYSKSEYKDSRTKVCVICPIHGEFWQTLNNHLNSNGCPKCAYINGAINKISSTEEFIQKAKIIHNNFYSYDKVIYNRAKINVIITCPIHGDFEQTPDHHLSGNNCSKCAKNYSYNTEEWIIKAKKKHGDKYDYSKVEYTTAHVKVCIICFKHGEFWSEPGKHLFETGCPICSSSHGEELIYNWLKENNIEFKREFELITPEIARDSNLIRIDFFVKHNECQYFIEYDGIQHFEFIPYFHKEIDSFYKQQRRDQILNKFCELNSNKVTLIRFNYKQLDNEIINILNNIINGN